MCNLDFQNASLDKKKLLALAISQAFETRLADKTRHHNYSSIQTQILIFISYSSEYQDAIDCSTIH